MPVSPAREAAYQILLRVETRRAFAVHLLQSQTICELQEADRGLATELTMGVLRWRGELDHQIAELSGKPLKYFDREVAIILRLGVYQIRFLERIPKAAVVNESVELVKRARKRSAAGLVNAVLRKCQPPAARGAGGGKCPATEDLERAARSMPSWLLERWEKHFGTEAAKALVWASNQIPPTTVRICRPEISREQVKERLAAEGIVTRPCRYASRGLRVESGDLQSSEAARERVVVAQDEASQLVGELVAPQAGQRVLDLCAAPGIKSSEIAAAMGSGTFVACDLSARRLRTMSTLMSRMIPPELEFYLVRLDAARHLPFAIKFDRILFDAPCSGTGTLARNPEIKWRLKPEDLSRLANLQAKILRNALAALAPGGRLVYATCSLESEENEHVVENVLQETSGFRRLGRNELMAEFPRFSELFDEKGFFRTRPDLNSMDGFFGGAVVRGS